jgi:transposase InsO family protein
MRYQFILENVELYPVEKMCKSMKVSKNSYYYWLNTKETIKVNPAKLLLMSRIKAIFKENYEIYGSHRIQKVLEREGLIYCRSYIGFLMREMDLRSILKRKFVVTTNSNHAYPISSNLLNREFVSLKLGEKWVSDITYIRVNDNWNYLTTILDLADRKIVGWSLSEDMTVENTVWKAWLLAINTRKIRNNFLFHSDQGVQYASNKMSSILRKNIKITQSMSRKGNCWDNAVAESLFKTIKHECTNRYKFTSYNQLYQCLSEYIGFTEKVFQFRSNIELFY